MTNLNEIFGYYYHVFSPSTLEINCEIGLSIQNSREDIKYFKWIYQNEV